MLCVCFEHFRTNCIPLEGRFEGQRPTAATIMRRHHHVDLLSCSLEVSSLGQMVVKQNWPPSRLVGGSALLTIIYKPRVVNVNNIAGSCISRTSSTFDRLQVRTHLSRCQHLQSFIPSCHLQDKNHSTRALTKFDHPVASKFIST